MSPLWRDEIAILFAPRRLSLTRMRRGLRPQCVADSSRDVDDGSFNDWRPALGVLDICLSEAAWQDARVRLVLSNHWTRYAIVPWSDDITTDEERVAHARICLGGIYGNVVDQWRVGLNTAAPGEARVACAIPGELLDALTAVLQAHKLPVGSIEPQLTAAYNGWRQRLRDAAGWFVSIDEGSLAAARLVRKGWDRVYSARIGTDWGIELERLKTFGRLAMRDAEGGRVFVDAPAWLRKLADVQDTGVEWLCDEADGDEAQGEAAVLRRMYA